MAGMLELARERGHFVRDGETEGSLITRMVVEGWMGQPHRPMYHSPELGPIRCRCLPMFPEFLGEDGIHQLLRVGPQELAICRYHMTGITCEACPQCVRCRRHMSSDLGHWVCDRVNLSVLDDKECVRMIEPDPQFGSVYVKLVALPYRGDSAHLSVAAYQRAAEDAIHVTLSEMIERAASEGMKYPILRHVNVSVMVNPWQQPVTHATPLTPPQQTLLVVATIRNGI
jgi:hypothetical protein